MLGHISTVYCREFRAGIFVHVGNKGEEMEIVLLFLNVIIGEHRDRTRHSPWQGRSLARACRCRYTKHNA